MPIYYPNTGGPGGGLADVVEDATPQLGGDLDANGHSIGFDDATGITDDSGNEQLIFQKTADAVNHFEVTNAAEGGSPSIAAVGSDTHIGITLTPKGSGSVAVGGPLTVNGSDVETLITDAKTNTNVDSDNSLPATCAKGETRTLDDGRFYHGSDTNEWDQIMKASTELDLDSPSSALEQSIADHVAANAGGGGTEYIGSTFDFLVAGRYICLTPDTTLATLSLVNKRAYYYPFIVSKSAPFDRIGPKITTTTAPSGSTIEIGLYNHTGGTLGILIESFGTVAADATGTPQITVSETLAPGIYWIGVVANFASGGVTVTSGSISPMRMSMSSANDALSPDHVLIQENQTTLPSTPASLSTTTSRPLVAIRGA